MLNLPPQAFDDRTVNHRGVSSASMRCSSSPHRSMGVGALRTARPPGHAWHGTSGVQFWSAPCRRCRSYRRHRQRHPQADAERKRPIRVGFWFATGHSAVVIPLALAIAITTAALASRFDALKSVGNLVGTLISALFLFLIAAMNVVILFGIGKAFHKVRRGGELAEQDFDVLLKNRGLMAKLFRPLFRVISRSWQMPPLGFLFGLGFDTATEVGLLGISATQAGRGMSIWAIIMFPALFAAGMSLIDTTDGVLMVGVYNWAFMQPIRRLYYSLVTTAVSVAVAVLIGSIEGLGLISDQLSLEGRFWTMVDKLNNNFNSIGFMIIGVFIFAWLALVIYYR